MPSPLRLVVFLALLAAAALAGAAPADSFHQDWRRAPRLVFEPDWRAPAGLAGEDLAAAYLEREGAAYGLTGLETLELARVRESILGTHFVFAQSGGGIPVEAAEFIVSVAKADGRVYRVFNNAYPVRTAPPAQTPLVDEEAAFAAAWDFVSPRGELLGDPAARLVLAPSASGFAPVWIVDLPVAAPYGAWRLRVDAASGAILDVGDANLYRVKRGFADRPVADRLDDAAGPVLDRREAFGRRAEAALVLALRERGERAQGDGVMFDPDPRATLMNDDLQDGSPPSEFVGSYFTRDLLDIEFSGGLYRVTGPWIDIINFDPPNTPPSTTADGHWTALRGDNSMNDAMTYFQIDQNQRYMQALGFTGASGIQEGPIGTDTDGVNGADNSYYQSGSNRMAFGHGCVDDSEDTDVMLHEYGHAINYSINSSWGGGDMGAIGEGFGDYWAGSYSYVTPNGMVYHPEWVFSWDGHGTGNQCWNGRILDAFGAVYDHNTNYGAHQGIPGGYISDELWSTPNFQSLITLMDLGETRESVDRIILEAQFGLGSGLKMRDMANAIIATAVLLEPGGPHAGVFIEKFAHHNIVEIPHVALQVGDVAVTDPGLNGAADPGETVQLQVGVVNVGTLGAVDVAAVLSTDTPGVTVLQGGSDYPDLPIGAEGANLVAYEVELDPDFPCGDPIDFDLTVSYGDGLRNLAALSFAVGTGTPVIAGGATSPSLPITDDYPLGVNSEFVVSGTGLTITENFSVDVDVTHPAIGELRVRLRSPAGTYLYLHSRTGGDADDIVGNYPGDFPPAEPLDQLIGEPLDGTWRLTVSDWVEGNLGVLNAWGVNEVLGHECEPSTAAPADAVPSAFALAPAAPNPFNPATTLRFAVPAGGAEIRLAVYDVSGRRVATLRDGFVGGGAHEAVWRGGDDEGRPVGSGVYFARLEAGDFAQTRKLVLIK